MSIRLIKRQGTNDKTNIKLYKYEDYKDTLPDVFETCYILNKYAKTDITVTDLPLVHFKDRRRINYHSHMIVNTSEKNNYAYLYKKGQTVPFAAKFILYNSYSEYGLCDINLLSDDIEIGKKEIDFSKIMFTTSTEIFQRHLEGVYHMNKNYEFPIRYIVGNHDIHIYHEENLDLIVKDYKDTKKKFEFLQETINLNSI